jgi:protein disulfide-isomerase
MKLDRMITGVVTALILVLSGVAAIADDASWLDDFEKAKAEAKEKGVPILVNFSGSDWCGWCIRLDKEVLSKEAFAAYAKKNLVLFVADFPSKKKLPKETVAQNQALQKEYKVKGCPTVLLLDAEGKVIARTGYKAGGAGAYVKHLQELLK